jgi:hypothetical protein
MKPVNNVDFVFFYAIVQILILCLFFTSCYENDEIINKHVLKSSSVWVDKAGGMVSLSEYQASLIIPAGAITTPSEVSMKISDLPEDLREQNLYQLGPAIQFGPAGLRFDSHNEPLLTLPYNSFSLSSHGLSEKNVRIFYYDVDLKTYIDLDGEINELNQTITIPIHHFSTYVALAHDIQISENQKPPVIGGPSFYPDKLVNQPFEVRFNIRDHNNAAGVDTENSLANVECYWEIIPFNASLVGDEAQLYGSILSMSRLLTHNNTYHFSIPANSITHQKDTLKITTIARDNVGFVSTKTFTLKGGFGEFSTVNAITPETFTLTGGYQRELKVKANMNYKTWDGDSWVTETGVLFVTPDSWLVTPSAGFEGVDLGYFVGNIFYAKQAGKGVLQPVFGTATSNLESHVVVHAAQVMDIRIIGEDGQLLDEDKTLGICRPEPYVFDAIGFDEFGNKIKIYPYWSVSNNLGVITTLGESAGSLDTSTSIPGSEGDVCISLAGHYSCIHVVVCEGDETIISNAIGRQMSPTIDYDGEGLFGTVWIDERDYYDEVCDGFTFPNNLHADDIYFRQIDHAATVGQEVAIYQGNFLCDSVGQNYQSTQFFSPKIKYGNTKLGVAAISYESEIDVNAGIFTETSKVLYSTLDTGFNQSTVITLPDTEYSYDFGGLPITFGAGNRLALDHDGEAFGIVYSHIPHDPVLGTKVQFYRIDENNNNILASNLIYNGSEGASLLDIAYRDGEYGVIWTSWESGTGNTFVHFNRIDLEGTTLSTTIVDSPNTMDDELVGSLIYNGSDWAASWTYRNETGDIREIRFATFDQSGVASTPITVLSDTDISWVPLMDWGYPYFGFLYLTQNVVSGYDLYFFTVNSETMEVSTPEKVNLSPATRIALSIYNLNFTSISTGGTSFGLVWSGINGSDAADIFFRQMCP